jgi:hypothetical protein
MCEPVLYKIWQAASISHNPVGLHSLLQGCMFYQQQYLFYVPNAFHLLRIGKSIGKTLHKKKCTFGEICL